MLTIKQSRLLTAIQEATDAGDPLTYRSLMRRLGHATPAAVHRGVFLLRERGFVAPDTRRIQLLRRIETITDGTPVGMHDPLVSMIHIYQTANGGVTPSIREMTTALGMTSLSSTHRLVLKAEQQGYLRRVVDRKTDRGLHVIKLQEDEAQRVPDHEDGHLLP